jgi:hypothetical protein
MTGIQVSEFLRLMDRADFWGMSPNDPGAPDLDGTRCMVDGHRGTRAHAVDRHRLGTGAFAEAATLLLKSAGLASWGHFRPLSQFELSKLQFLGTRRKARGDIVALVRAPDGVTETVRVGDGMGADFGVVRKITRDFIKLSELQLDCADGEWRERDNYLPRVGAAVAARFSTTVRPTDVQAGRTADRCNAER